MEPGKLRELTADEVNALRLTAEGKMKPRAMRVTLPKEARRAPGTRGGKAWDRGTKGPREQASRGAGERGSERYAGKPGGFSGQRREERGPRTEWKPREQTFGGATASGAGRSSDRGGDRPRFDKRAGGPPRAGSGFGARPSRPFGARPAFGARREGDAGRSEGGAGRSGERKEWKPREGSAGGRSEGKPFRREEKTGFGERGSRPPRTNSGFDKRGGKPFGARPAFGGGREGGAGRSGERGGERKEWKPREQATGGFESAPRKPFVAQSDRPAFVRPEGSFKRTDGPKKRFEGARSSGSGAGKSFGRRTGSKERWVPRPSRARTEEGRGQTGGAERPAPAFGEKRWEGKGATEGTGRSEAGRTRPAFGARPGGFKRPGKPGGFSRPGGFAKPGSFSRPGRPGGGTGRGGARFGGKRTEGQ